MRKIAILVTFTVCVPWMSAQRAASSFAHFSRPISPHNPSGVTGGFDSRPDSSLWRRLYRGNSYGDYLGAFGLFPEALGESASYATPSAAPNFFVMPSVLSGMTEDRPQAAVQPLMIELRGDHYVRVMSGGETEKDLGSRQESSGATSAREVSAQEIPAAAASSPKLRASRSLEPAVLIFRDGHQESVRDYAISGGTLYARGDFYTDGYWTKNINLAQLDVPATISSNSERGVKFILPSAPNEVVTRP